MMMAAPINSLGDDGTDRPSLGPRLEPFRLGECLRRGRAEREVHCLTRERVVTGHRHGSIRKLRDS